MLLLRPADAGTRPPPMPPCCPLHSPPAACRMVPLSLHPIHPAFPRPPARSPPPRQPTTAAYARPAHASPCSRPHAHHLDQHQPFDDRSAAHFLLSNASPTWGASVVLLAACRLLSRSPVPTDSAAVAEASQPPQPFDAAPASTHFERPVACGNRAAPTANTQTGARGGDTGQRNEGGSRAGEATASHRSPEPGGALSVIIGFSDEGDGAMERRWSR